MTASGPTPAAHGRCLNCDTPLTGPYCAACGQSARLKPLSLRYLLPAVAGELFDFASSFIDKISSIDFERIDSVQDFIEEFTNAGILPAGTVVEEGVLRANVEFPGLTIRFTTDGTEPTATSTPYTGVVRVTSDVKLKAFNTLGRASSTSEAKASQ